MCRRKEIEALGAKFDAVVTSVYGHVAKFGFVERKGSVFTRVVDGLTQRLSISLREILQERNAFVEAFVGFNFPEIERRAAELQNKRVRPDFITCSLNIGLLTERHTAVEWTITDETQVDEVAHMIHSTVDEYGLPFWDNYSSIERLIESYSANDNLLCRGSEWPWRCVAACEKAGDMTRGLRILTDFKQTMLGGNHGQFNNVMDVFKSIPRVR
ncbi:MAG: hypothetical protein ACJ8C4_06260 [Gemmataceae bacterium]